MVERSSITAKAVNNLHFKEGGLVPADTSTESQSFRERYFEEVNRYYIDRPTATKYFKALSRKEGVDYLTRAFDEEVERQLADAYNSAREYEALRQAHKRETEGIMTRRQTIRNQPEGYLYSPESPSRNYMSSIRSMFANLQKQQKDIG